MRKFKHRQTGDIAQLIEAQTPFYRTEESNWYIDPKYVENSSDREEIKETPEYADNGMYIGENCIDPYSTPTISLNRSFETKEELLKRERKNHAERKIRKRKAENDGEWKAEWENIGQSKYYVYYDIEDMQLDRNVTKYERQNNIYFSEEGAKKVIKEIKDYLIIYLTY